MARGIRGSPGNSARAPEPPVTELWIPYLRAGVRPVSVASAGGRSRTTGVRLASLPRPLRHTLRAQGRPIPPDTAFAVRYDSPVTAPGGPGALR